MRTYYLALVSPTDTTFSATFARHDVHMKSFSVTQTEAGFAMLSIEIENPDVALLDPSRKIWCWLSMEEGTALTPLFFGRIVGVPADIQKDFLTADFVAQPSDFEDRKKTLAATLRVYPYYDPAFIDPQSWDDPDTVLEARTDVWHIERLTHDVTISSIIAGEDGTISVPESAIPADQFELSYTEAPLKMVRLEMKAMWTQHVEGSINITQDLLDAFEAAGSQKGFVTSYTGDGLWNDWPMDGDDLSNIYKFGPQLLAVADYKWIKTKYKTTKVKYKVAPKEGEPVTGTGPYKVDFRRWAFTIDSTIAYSANVDRTENIALNVYADIQAMVSDEEQGQSEKISMSSGQLGVPLGNVTGAEVPIGDVSRDSYFPSARGRHSIEFGLCHARALLARRARAVEVKIGVPFTVAVEATLRKSATVYHPKLPGGFVTGKITAYEFGVDGGSGKEKGAITVSCTVGRDSALTEIAGVPTYADADYVGSDYQVFTGKTVTYEEIGMSFSPPASPPVDALDIGVQSVIVVGGEHEQWLELKKTHLDIDAVCDALNALHTEVRLKVKVVDTSPRVLDYYDSDVTLTLPRGVDLGGA